MKISIIIPVYNVEQYIKETMLSIQEQTLADYEVILVNDGSTDQSQTVIDEFCKTDQRFKSFTKENEGVSIARNYALDRAEGEYVLFVDGDDIIPQYTLENMYRKAKENKADAVVGAMQEFGIHGEVIYAATRNLAKQKEIDRYDPNFLWTFSVCNKLLRKELIDRNHLRFEKIKHAEDGLFLFQYLYKCNMIVGCDMIVYRYRKRPFWEGKSATQAASMGHLQDLLYALGEILKLAEKQREIELKKAEKVGNDGLLYIEETRCKFDMYLSQLHSRIIEASLINGYYRQIWKSDDDVLKVVEQNIEKYRRGLFPSDWEKIVEKHQDLRLGQGMLSKEEILEAPLVTVVISDLLPAAYVGSVLESVFNQQMPAIVIYVHGKYKNIIETDYANKANVFVFAEEQSTVDFKNEVLGKAKSPYIVFIDEPMYTNVNTYRSMYQWMEKNEATDFCGSRLKLIAPQGDTRLCRAQEVGFYQKYNKSNSIFRSLDWMMSNKMFRTSSLKSLKEPFHGTAVQDTAYYFRHLNYKTMWDAITFSVLTENEIIGRGTNWKAKLLWKHCHNKIERKSQSYINYKKRQIENIKRAVSWNIKKILIAMVPVKKQVLFVTVRGNQLADNIKAAYEAYDGKKVCFAKRYPHSVKDKARLYLKLFGSKVIITDDYLKYFRMFEMKPKQRVIQIWHACGAFKKFGLDYISSSIEKEKQTHEQYDAVIVSAESIREIYAKAFGISTDKVQALGVPRTDLLLNQDNLKKERAEFFEKYPSLQNKTLLLYAPTFREDGTVRVELHPHLDWAEISRTFGNDKVLIIRNHPIMKYDLLKGEKYKNIINMPNEDTNRLMNVCDVTITDYSSIVFEAALLNKPLVLYCPDYESYERDFYLQFPEDLYGEFAQNQTQLLAAIDTALKNPDEVGMKRFRQAYMGSCDGHSAEKVTNLIKQYLNEA